MKDKANRVMKPIARRRHRRVVNQAVRTGAALWPEELAHPYEVMDPYDVCDYRGLCSGDCATCWRKEEQYKCRIK